MIWEKEEDIKGLRSFKTFIGMLSGPRDFLVFRREIILDISWGTEGAMNKELPILSPIKSKGDFVDLGMFLVILWETLTKNLLETFAIIVGSEVILPLESLSLLITLMLES